jgi:hypothetical protein
MIAARGAEFDLAFASLQPAERRYFESRRRKAAEFQRYKILPAMRPT